MRGEDRLLLVVTGGQLVIDPATDRIDPAQTNCLPAFAPALFHSEPLWVDLTWTGHRMPTEASAVARFSETAAEVAAAISEVAKDELVGENIRQRRRTRNLVRAAIAILIALALLAVAGGVVAVQQRNLAQGQLLQASSRQLVAAAAGLRDTQPNLARQLILTAYRQAPSPEALAAVLGSATVPVSADGPISDLTVPDPVRNLVAFARDQTLEFRSVDNAAVMTSVTVESPIRAMAYAGDGSLLTAVDETGALRAWSLTDPLAPREVATPTVGAGRLVDLAFLGISPHLAVLSDTGQVMMLDLSHPNRVIELDTVSRSESGGGSALRVSADGRRLISCHDDVVVWNAAADGRLRLEGRINVGTCDSMALSADGFLLAITDGDLVTLFDIADVNRPRRLAPLAGQRGGAGPIAFSADRTSLAIGAGDGSIRIWNIADPVRPTLTDQVNGLGGAVTTLAFAAASDALVAQIRSQFGGSGEEWGWLRVWPVRAGARSAQLGELFTVGAQVAYSPDGRQVLAGLPPRLWDISDRHRPVGGAVVGGYRFGGQGLAMSHQRKRFAVGTPPVIYDLTDGGRPQRLTESPPAETEPYLMQFLPGDRTLLTSSIDDLVLWDVGDPAAPRKLATIGSRSTQIQGAAISRDGRLLAVVEDGFTLIYDITTPAAPRLAFRLGTPNASVVSFVGSTDTFAVASSTGTLDVWRRDDDNYAIVGSTHRHAGNIGGLGSHPILPWLATSGEDGTVRLWDLDDQTHPRELAVYSHHSIYGAATVWFSPDGKTLATAGSESTRFWNVDLHGTLVALCAMSVDLTPAEWSAYLPQRSYDPPCR